MALAIKNAKEALTLLKQRAAEREPGAGLLAVTSADHLHASWLATQGTARVRRRHGSRACRAPARRARPRRGARHRDIIRL
jgi:pyruvate dehydrogenase complex dehydrogenase (E1) component